MGHLRPARAAQDRQCRRLFDYIAAQADQDVCWIGENVNGVQALPRHSWAARLAIARAPVLIYSHGEDDFDACLSLCRTLLGFTVYLGHGANLVKRGAMHPDVLKHKSLLHRAASRFVVTDYDLLPCQSQLEKSFWDANRPTKASRHVVINASARLDAILDLTGQEPEQRIVWFPTFRDTAAARRQLTDTVQAVCAHPDLHRFLIEEGYMLDIGLHVNHQENFTEIAGLSSNISVFYADELPHRLSRASLLVTDYSSVLIDWLLFDRPAVFFPFDLNAYERVRGFHQPYESYVYGPRADTPDQLVAVLKAELGFDSEAAQTQRAELRTRFLGAVEGGNAATCYSAIRSRAAL